MRKFLSIALIPVLFILSSGIIHGYSAYSAGTNTGKTRLSHPDPKSKIKLEINALNNLSTEYKDSIIQFTFDLAEKALRKSQSIKYGKGEAYASINLGIYYYVKKSYLKSMDYYMNASNYADANGDAFIGNEVNKGMELIFTDLGRRARAIEYGQRIWTYAIKKNNVVDLLGCFIVLGQLMIEQGDTNAAFRFYFNALALKPKLTKRSLQVWLMKSLGNFYLSTKKYDLALYYYREAIKENPKDFGNLNGTIYSIMAHTYEQINELDNALMYNRLALNFRKNENQPWLVTSSLLNIGHTYYKMGNYDSSFYYINTGLREANQFKINYLLESGNKYLYELCLAKKDWKNSLFALQEYDKAQDNVEIEKNKDQITLTENNRIISEKEEQAEELRNENSIQKLEVKNRNLLLLLMIALAFLAIALAVYIQQLLINNRKEKKIVEEENDHLQEEIKEQVIQNKELSKREQEYRFLTDHSADLITLMDSNFRCIYISPSSELFLGYTPEELMNLKDFRELIFSESMEVFSNDFTTMLNYHEPTRFVYQLIKKDGTSFWVESNINPIFDSSSGKLKAMLSVTRDITSQIGQEEALMETAKQKELLIREVHHRVKNNLSILTSIVNMQKREVTDVKTLDIFSDLQFRVRAMALVHEQLYKSRNIEVLPIGEYLSNLVGIVSSAFTTKKVVVHKEFIDEIVDVKITLPLGLIVNELLTNAYKYAFADHQEGNIWVTYEKAPKSKKYKCEMRRLTVRDDGIGLPPGFELSQRTSMGSQIIFLLTKQLEGELTIQGEKGASFSILLPLE